MFNAMEGIAGKYDAMTWTMVLSGCVLFSLIALHYLTLIRLLVWGSLQSKVWLWECIDVEGWLSPYHLLL
jgi:hypothetical protein